MRTQGSDFSIQEKLLYLSVIEPIRIVCIKDTEKSVRLQNSVGGHRSTRKIVMNSTKHEVPFYDFKVHITIL